MSSFTITTWVNDLPRAEGLKSGLFLCREDSGSFEAGGRGGDPGAFILQHLQ